MALSKLIYTKDWNSPNDFPTVEVSEAIVRSDMQELWDQTKVGVNKIASELEATTGADQIGVVAPDGVSGTTVQAIIDSLKEILDTKSDDAIVSDTYETKTDAGTHIIGVELDEQTGIFTFTRENGTSFTVDTILEKIAVNFEWDTENQRLILTLRDGTVQYLSLSEFITETEFLDTNDIEFSVSGHKVSAVITSGYKSEMVSLKNSAGTSAANAAASETNAGTFADNASASALAASLSAADALTSQTLSQSYAKGGTGSRGGEATDNAKFYSEQAATSANSSRDSAIASSGSATLSESWAKGGTGVRADEATNNAKYFAEKALSDSSVQATLSASYAKGGTGTRADEDTDNAKYYMEQAAAIVSGKGLMAAVDYDADNTVKAAGGIVGYVSSRTSIIEASLLSSNWNSGIYSFEGAYPATSYDLEIALNSSATADQAEAFNGAQIVGSATENAVKAFGIVPTVNIPIIVKVVHK